MMTSMNIAEFPMLLAAGALDFDITIIFQFGIFILAIALLHNILIKPYLQTREARDEGTEGSREEADEMQQLAVQRRAEYEDQLSEVRRDAMGVREELRNQGVAEQEDMLDEVRREVAAKLTEERGKINTKVREAEDELDARAKQIAELMVSKILPELEA
ncbi:MAG: ATP synthase F0 subunit B [Myxococcota bacterium]|jgi:F0F1-type ATP synthase membrane subunit b/b'|nr:ATP synthase F0 subunit B [Myxococcota bacterium]MEC9442646.1 ATP synthase F0 subunit B [Myxococcota bacterium]